MSRLTVLLAALSVAGAAQAQTQALDPAALAFTPPDHVAWQGDGKTGPQSFVLWGDPTKPGPYAILVRWPPHLGSRPHTHPHDRHITVISGTWWVGTGKSWSPETAVPMPAGTVVTHFANQFHYDGARDEAAVLEIVGEGPQ